MLLCFVDPILGNLTVRGHSLSQGTWGCRILTLHLNYVAGYTGPLLFLFERTHKCGRLQFFKSMPALRTFAVKDSMAPCPTTLPFLLLCLSTLNVLIAPSASDSSRPTPTAGNPTLGLAVSVVEGDWHAMQAFWNSLSHRLRSGFVRRVSCTPFQQL